jgi:hypothetical protein
VEEGKKEESPLATPPTPPVPTPPPTTFPEFEF